MFENPPKNIRIKEIHRDIIGRIVITYISSLVLDLKFSCGQVTFGTNWVVIPPTQIRKFKYKNEEQTWTSINLTLTHMIQDSSCVICLKTLQNFEEIKYWFSLSHTLVMRSIMSLENH